MASQFVWVVLAFFTLFTINGAVAIRCIDCTFSMYRDYCTVASKKLSRDCGLAVTKCYIHVENELEFARGCEGDQIYQNCQNASMNNCVTCHFDNCNTDPVIDYLSDLECQICVGYLCYPPLTGKCDRVKNLLGRPWGCYMKYVAGQMESAGCLQKWNYIPPYDTSQPKLFNINCFGWYCFYTQNLKNWVECSYHNCTATNASQILGCYGDYTDSSKSGCLTAVSYKDIPTFYGKKSFMCIEPFVDRACFQRTMPNQCDKPYTCRGTDDRCYLEMWSHEEFQVRSHGCASELTFEQANSDLIYFCSNKFDSQNCNKRLTPREMHGCHDCEGAYCNDVYYNIHSKVECPSSPKSCYTTMLNSIVYRGCGIESTCKRYPRFCQICNGTSYCNNQKVIRNPKTCPQTLKQKYHELDSFTTVVLRRCPGLTISGLNDKCLRAKFPDGSIIYSCYYADFAICDGIDIQCIYANTPRELVVPFKCLKCKEKRTMNNACEHKLKVLVPKVCGFKKFGPFEGCYVRYRSEDDTFERGCLADLEPMELAQCFEPLLHYCSVCITEGCNTARLYQP